ncbi:thioredoxin [bacterium]|nr:thioredoxin [bacterium]
MKTGIVLLLSAFIILAVMLKAGTEGPEADRPDSKKPDITQEQPKVVDNSPIFENDYKKAKSHAERNVLVIFGADWCKYCKILKGDMPIMNLEGYVVCVVDITKDKEIKARNGVSSLPTSIVMDNGKEVARTVGYSPQAYKGWLDANRRLAK